MGSGREAGVEFLGGREQALRPVHEHLLDHAPRDWHAVSAFLISYFWFSVLANGTDSSGCAFFSVDCTIFFLFRCLLFHHCFSLSTLTFLFALLPLSRSLTHSPPRTGTATRTLATCCALPMGGCASWTGAW